MGFLAPVASVVSGFMGMSSANSAAAANREAAAETARAQREGHQANLAINQANLEARERERRDAIAQARLNQEESRRFEEFARQLYERQVADRNEQVDERRKIYSDQRGDYQSSLDERERIYRDQQEDRIDTRDTYERQREDLRRQFEQQKGDNREGYTDGQGNRTQYIPGQGWVTTAAPVQETAQQRAERLRADEDEEYRRETIRERDANLREDRQRSLLEKERDEQWENENRGYARETQDYVREKRADSREDRSEKLNQRARTAEQYQDYRSDREDTAKQMNEVFRQIAQENPLQTENLRATFSQQGRERDFAKATLEDLKGLRQEDPIAFENLLYGRNAEAIGEAFDETDKVALRNAMRTGGETGAIVRESGKARAGQLRKAATDAMIQARGVTEKEYNDRRNTLANLYGAFSASAAKPINIQRFNPVDRNGPTFRESETINDTAQITTPKLDVLATDRVSQLSPEARYDYVADDVRDLEAKRAASATAGIAKSMREDVNAIPYTPYVSMPQMAPRQGMPTISNLPAMPNYDWNGINGARNAGSELTRAFAGQGGTLAFQTADTSMGQMLASNAASNKAANDATTTAMTGMAKTFGDYYNSRPKDNQGSVVSWW